MVNLLKKQSQFADQDAIAKGIENQIIQNNPFTIHTSCPVKSEVVADPNNTESANGHILNNANVIQLWSRTYEKGWEPIIIILSLFIYNL